MLTPPQKNAKNIKTSRYFAVTKICTIRVYNDKIDIDSWQWIPLTDDSNSDYASIVHMIYHKIETSSLNYTFSKYARAIN